MFIFGFLATFIYNLFPIPTNDDIKILFYTKDGLPTTKDILFWSAGGFVYGILAYLFYYFKEWILFSLLVLSYICMLIFIPDIRYISNDISKLINPLNIFKAKDYFEHIAPYGMFVKLIMSVLIYQFIMAFRQNTRRK